MICNWWTSIQRDLRTFLVHETFASPHVHFFFFFSRLQNFSFSSARLFVREQKLFNIVLLRVFCVVLCCWRCSIHRVRSHTRAVAQADTLWGAHTLFEHAAYSKYTNVIIITTNINLFICKIIICLL